MLTELVVRFVLGGAIVTAFAVLGELVSPKTLSGIFGAAPSVAIATLALAFHKHVPSTIATEARAMLIGCAGMLAYCFACVRAAALRRVPVWLGALAAWLVWGAVAFGLEAVL